MVMVLENHTLDPVEVEEGLVLGRVQEAKIPGEPEEESSGVVAAVVPDDFTEVRLQRLRESLSLDEANLTAEERKQLETLVMEFADVFAVDSSELGSTDLVTHSINTGESPPIKQPARRMPFALRHTVEELVQQMLEQGVIEPSHSPWSSPVVLVEKKDGSHRFCVDYRQLNSVTKMDVFPLPRIDDILDTLAGAQYFTTLDLASGFWQVKMDAESQEKTAFVTHSGLYEFKVMPFGLCNSPATFQRLIETVLMGLIPQSLWDTLMICWPQARPSQNILRT